MLKMENKQIELPNQDLGLISSVLVEYEGHDFQKILVLGIRK